MFRRLWAKRFVKITKQTGEGEIVEVTFNDHDDEAAQESTAAWLDLLHDRMKENNQRVLHLEDQRRAREAAKK